MSAIVRMPSLFVGHGSPMNAIQSNDFTQTLKQLGKNLPRPKAILCISAHWMTRGSTQVTAMTQPKTIHDFYGFPQALFDIQYPAPGHPEVAQLVIDTVSGVIADTHTWGLDHGAWSVLVHTHPKADIPVVQLSMDMNQPGEFHYEMGKKLAPLRDQGVMILGSGNIVHNLRQLYSETSAPADWAVEFDEWTKDHLLRRDFKPLHSEYLNAPHGPMSVPTPDHYYPLLYVLGAASEEDHLVFDYEGFQNGSLSMRSVRFS